MRCVFPITVPALLVPTTALFMFAGSSTAQEDLLACVDPNVREGLRIGAASRHNVVTGAVPEELLGVAEPERFEFIGSSESPFYTIAAFRTPSTPGNALENVSGTLGDAGWREYRPFGPARGGFVSSYRPLNQYLCRDGNTVSVSSRLADDATYVSMNISAVPEGNSCDDMLSDPRGALAARVPGLALHDRMPSLTLPEGARTRDPRQAALSGTGSISGSDRFLNTTVNLDTDLSAQALVDHFARQLRDQGWSDEASWSGERSVGSVWFATPEADLNLMGLLDVLSLGESGYQATFRISIPELD